MASAAVLSKAMVLLLLIHCLLSLPLYVRVCVGGGGVGGGGGSDEKAC